MTLYSYKPDSARWFFAEHHSTSQQTALVVQHYAIFLSLPPERVFLLLTCIVSKRWQASTVYYQVIRYRKLNIMASSNARTCSSNRPTAIRVTSHDIEMSVLNRPLGRSIVLLVSGTQVGISLEKQLQHATTNWPEARSTIQSPTSMISTSRCPT